MLFLGFRKILFLESEKRFLN